MHMDFLLNHLKLYQVTYKKGGKKVKINTSFSSWTQLLQEVSQGSVLSPMLFNIYVNDLLFALNEIDICNSADDTARYVCDSNLKAVLRKVRAQF